MVDDAPNPDLGSLVTLDTVTPKALNNQAAFMLHVFSIGQGKVRNVFLVYLDSELTSTHCSYLNAQKTRFLANKRYPGHVLM